MKRVCAWCGAVLAPGSDDRVTHGICLDCLPGSCPIAVEDLRQLDARDMDALPWGVIRLDRENRVVAYSEDEACRSGLARADVLGAIPSRRSPRARTCARWRGGS